MSQSSKSSKTSNSISGLSREIDQNKTINTPVVDRAPKRGAFDQDDQIDDQVKKIKIEHESHEQNDLKDVSKLNSQPKFIRASQITIHHPNTTIENTYEMSDEELLSMVIKFEMEHPEYN